jgi:hypothetical protein
VSLTFDDGDESQIKVGIPRMEERGLKGTFFLCPKGDDYAERLGRWKAIAARGHEIGNHSLGHRCSCNLTNDPDHRGLEKVTLEEIEADVLEAERRLSELFPGAGQRNFCYPCYQTDVGQGLTRRSYVPVIAKHFLAARVGGEYGIPNHPLHADLHFLVSCDGTRMSGPELAGLAERAARQGRWVIYAFHGIDRGRLSLPEYEFVDLLDHLAGNKHRLWTAPMKEIAEYLIAVRQKR